MYRNTINYAKKKKKNEHHQQSADLSDFPFSYLCLKPWTFAFDIRSSPVSFFWVLADPDPEDEFESPPSLARDIPSGLEFVLEELEDLKKLKTD